MISSLRSIGSKAASLAVGSVMPLLLGGCSCQERIHVENATNEMLHVQIQLPKPEVPWACGCKCVYETLVAPGGIWTSARPGSPDLMDYTPEPYSECAVVRVRGESSAMWTRYTVCGPLVKASSGDPILVQVTPGGPNGFSGTATTKSGATVEVSIDQVP